MLMLPVRAEIANPNPQRYGLRSPKGGCTVAGKFYRGGCFCLPFDPANPHGLAIEDATLWAELPGSVSLIESPSEPPPVEPVVPGDPGDSWETWDDSADLPWGLGPDAEPIEVPAPALDLTGFSSRSTTVGEDRKIEPAPVKLAINGFTYIAREIPAGECGSVAFELHKIDTNNRYHVIRDNDGLVSCDCPDYLMRHDGQGTCCKHGRKLIGLGLLPAPTPIPSTLGRREFLTPRASILRNVTPTRIDYPARARRFDPSADEMVEAAQLFGDLASERASYASELAECL